MNVALKASTSRELSNRTHLATVHLGQSRFQNSKTSVDRWRQRKQTDVVQLVDKFLTLCAHLRRASGHGDRHVDQQHTHHDNDNMDDLSAEKQHNGTVVSLCVHQPILEQYVPT